MRYRQLMQTTLDHSTDAKTAEDLTRARRKRNAVKVNQDWRTASGAMEDTPDARTSWKLGEQWRREQTDP